MKNENMVTKATKHVRSLAKRRSNRIVTADDVQNYLTKNRFRGSQNERLSVVRSVLNENNFLQSGLRRSNREVARGRTITAWTV